MKRILSLALVCALMITLFPTVTFAADDASLIYTTFADYEVYSSTTEDAYCHVPIDIHTYCKITATKNTPVAVYIKNHSMERIGTEGDISIISDLLDEYIVVVADYKNAKEAVSPNLEWGVNHLINQVNSGVYTSGLSFRKNYIYQIPEGCRVVKDILYFELDKHAPNGTINYIIEVWNKYYAGKMKDANGNLLPTATTIEECIKKDGTPIDLDLRLDIVYPSNPKETVPVFMLAASSETSRKTAITIDRPVYTGMLLNGYAGVCYDHEYIPMSRDDHYGYLNDAFTLYHYTANRSHSAAIRRVRQLAHLYGYSADYMGNWGFSKSSCGPAWLSDKTHLEKGEVRYWDAKYNPNGESPYESPEEQPYLTYNDGTEISSNVTVTYSGSGPGFHMHAEKTLPKIKENQVPTLNSSGRFDDTGNFFKLYPPVYKAFEEYHMESLTLPIDNIAHTYPQGYDATHDTDYYKTYFDFFDNQIRSAYRKEAPIVLWTTPNDKTEILSTSVPVEVKFSRAMDVDSVKAGINVVNEATGEKEDGTWNIYNGNTKFVFIPNELDISTKYIVEVTNKCKAEDGVNLSESMVKRFKVLGSEQLDVTKDAFVESGNNADVNFGNEKSAKVYYGNVKTNKAYFGFTRDSGFLDVVKATLVLGGERNAEKAKVYALTDNAWEENTITWNNAPANNKEGIGFVAEKTFGKKEIASIDLKNGINYIDVTDYIKNTTGKDLTFAVESVVKHGVTQNYTFEDMQETDFKSGTHYRLGGGSATVSVVSNDAYTGNKSLKISKRQNLNTRMKLYNSFSTAPLTNDHLGTKYRVSAHVKAIEDTTIKLGAMYELSMDYEAAITKNIKANEWTYIENVIEISQEMIDNDTRLVTIQPMDAVDTFYIDDLKVENLSQNEFNFATKESGSDLAPKLLLETSSNITETIGDTVYVESGFSADKNFSTKDVLYVKGADKYNTRGMQKAYMLLPIDNVDTATGVNLKFDIKSPVNQNILVYGLDMPALNTAKDYSSPEEFFGCSEAWDETITWNSALGNDKDGIGLISDFAYGNAPIATIDASVSGQKSVDVTAFVKKMKTEGAKNATFVLAAEKQGRKTTIDFESDISKYELKLSHANSSYEIAQGGFDGTGHALRFIRSGDQATGGYSQAISINNFVDANGGLWTKDDIGKTIKISWKAKGITSPLQTSGYKHTFVTSVATSGAGTLENTFGGSSATAQQLGTCIVKINQPANTWGSYSMQFTITEDMLKDEAELSKNALVFSGYWGSKEIWLDDITVEYLGDSVTIVGGNAQTTAIQKKYTFDEENVDLSQFVLRQDSANLGSTITIAKGEGKDGTNALLFTKTQSFVPSLAIPFIINNNNVLTQDDIGKTFKVSFDAKLTRGFGATEGSNIILAKIGKIGVGPVDFTAATNLSSIGCLGNIADTRVRTQFSLGQWQTVTMQFTITPDMVANHPDRTYLYMNAFTNIGTIHLDNIISEVVIPAKEGPHLEVVGTETTKNDALQVNMISSSNPDTHYTRGDTVIKREDFVDGVYGAKKSYLQYVVENNDVIKSAVLFINVLNDMLNEGQTLDLYAFNDVSFDKDDVTYNNAPYNDIYTNSIQKTGVWGGEKLASITAKKGENEIDVTEYVKKLTSNVKAAFALVTEDTPNNVVFEKDFENVKEFLVPRDARFGGQPTIKYNVNTESNNSFVTFSNIKYAYSRVRFKNVFGKPHLTTNDIGKKYKISFSVRPSVDTIFLIGVMSTYPGSSLSTSNDFGGGGFNKLAVEGGKWTDLSFVYNVRQASVNAKLNALSFEQQTPGATFDVDNIKVEEINDAYEIKLDKDVTLNIAYNEPDLTESTVSFKEINSTGNFNKGDSVIVNAQINSKYNTNVENVEFYVNGNLSETPVINKGNIYTLKLLNLQPGEYEINVIATFDNGDTDECSETVVIGENVSFESVKTWTTKKLEGEKGFTLTKKVKSNLDKNTYAYMVVGIYDAENNLLDVIKGNKQIIGAGEYKELTVTTDKLKTLSDDAYAKVMIWTYDANLPVMESEIVR